MPLVNCPACGKELSDTAPACPHCGQPAGKSGGVRRGRRGVPVWGKILLILLLGAVVVCLFAANKPSEAELRQAIRDKARELGAKGANSPLALIDAPRHAGRFTYREHFFTTEIEFTRDDGKVITVARGQLGDIAVSDSWEGVGKRAR